METGMKTWSTTAERRRDRHECQNGSFQSKDLGCSHGLSNPKITLLEDKSNANSLNIIRHIGEEDVIVSSHEWLDVIDPKGPVFNITMWLVVVAPRCVSAGGHHHVTIGRCADQPGVLPFQAEGHVTRR